ncbi:MAG: triose-phosphate isomerase [Candidatus Marinimicrobia bacterium]|nr:triose-phosphate isomerase [Candidatus Neomarinimicrobiota bacterium]
MSEKIVAANWKMNKDVVESAEFAKELSKKILNVKKTGVILSPPYTSLFNMNEILKDTIVSLSGQNMHFEDAGAFTAEISAKMLNSVNCEYVILGHSERRHVFNESDETIKKKIDKAFASGLKPILCVGEKLEERKSENTAQRLETQYTSAFEGVSEEDFSKCIIAYEPVWAIGTGETATPEQADEAHLLIRKLTEEKYDKELANDLKILYGGSVKPHNAQELIETENIDGFLVGGASLQVQSFYEIIEIVENYLT